MGPRECAGYSMARDLTRGNCTAAPPSMSGFVLMEPPGPPEKALTGLQGSKAQQTKKGYALIKQQAIKGPETSKASTQKGLCSDQTTGRSRPGE